MLTVISASHIEQVGSLDKNNINVGSGLVGAPACGDGKSLRVPAFRQYHSLTFLATLLPQSYSAPARPDSPLSLA